MCKIQVYSTTVFLVIFALLGNNVHSAVDVSQKCLGCICEATSRCNMNRECVDDNCGPFNIIKAYWDDAGSPTVDDVPSGSMEAYRACTQNITCAAIAVQAYMDLYQTDCNLDGKVDCDDFIMLHWFGGGSCTGKQLPLDDEFTQRYYSCKKVVNLV